MGIVGYVLANGRRASSFAPSTKFTQALAKEGKQEENSSCVGTILMLKPKTLNFEPKSHFDKKGLLYYIGTDELSHNLYVNPVILDEVQVKLSHPLFTEAMRAKSAIDHYNLVDCYWGGSCPQWLTIDIGAQRRLKCTAFSLRHGYKDSNSFMQNWSFSGSLDGDNWVALYSSFDTPFSKAFDEVTVSISETPNYYRYFRVLQKGKYSMKSQSTAAEAPYLCIAGLELYGECIFRQ